MTIVDAWREDFHTRPPRIKEFPVSTMSADLALAIGAMLRRQGRDLKSGLDVGVGNGLHAAAMAEARLQKIVGIDISPSALRAARSRLGRVLRSSFPGVTTPKLRLQDFSQLRTGDLYDFITTNPPSFFAPAEPARIRSPLLMALYDGDRISASDPGASFLYRFFDCVVRNHLRSGGLVLCTWPAIEARLVEDDRGRLVHPVARLSEWFSWRFSTRACDADAFFHRTANVARYGPTDKITHEISQNRAGYSQHLRVMEDGSITFRYGVLALRSAINKSNQFTLLNLPSFSKGR